MMTNWSKVNYQWSSDTTRLAFRSDVLLHAHYITLLKAANWSLVQFELVYVPNDALFISPV